MRTTSAYYIYGYLNPFDNKYFYVGKGSCYRYKVHLQDVINNRMPNKKNRHLYYKIKNIVSRGSLPIIQFLYHTNDEIKAYEMEKLFIEDIGYDNLCNLDYGGKGGMKQSAEQRIKSSLNAKGRKMSDENKELLRQRMIEDNPFRGKTHNAATIENIKNKLKEYYLIHEGTRKGAKLTEQQRQKMSIISSGPKPNRRGYKNKLSKKVFQYDKSYTLIKIWDCANDIVREYGFSRGTISDVILGKRKTAYNYIWSRDELCAK